MSVTQTPELIVAKKPGVYSQFMKALKAYWKETLPGIKPLKDRRLGIPLASSFDAGVIASTGQHVYLGFQTSWKEAGYFTVNFYVVDRGLKLSVLTQTKWNSRSGWLSHGGHRISEFVGRDDNPHPRRHDKWWHLCDVRERAVGDGLDDRMRELTIRLREGNWTAASYADETQVVEAAVTDVTQDVKTALAVIGIPT